MQKQKTAQIVHEGQILGLDTIDVTAASNDDFIKSRIFSIRGVQVMLDSDLARIYQVETRVFNQSVKRNANRFPSDFRFRLEMEEYRSLISQIVTSKSVLGETRGGRQKAPYVFTEQGIAMLSGMLKSDVAVQVSIRLMNIFSSGGLVRDARVSKMETVQSKGGCTVDLFAENYKGVKEAA